MIDALERIRRLLAVASDRRAALEEAKIGGRRLALMLRAHRVELRLPGIGTLVLDAASDQWVMRRDASSRVQDSEPGNLGGDFVVDLSGLRGFADRPPWPSASDLARMRRAHLDALRREAHADNEQRRRRAEHDTERIWAELREMSERLQRERAAAAGPYTCDTCGETYRVAHACPGRP